MSRVQRVERILRVMDIQASVRRGDPRERRVQTEWGPIWIETRRPLRRRVHRLRVRLICVHQLVPVIRIARNIRPEPHRRLRRGVKAGQRCDRHRPRAAFTSRGIRTSVLEGSGSMGTGCCRFRNRSARPPQSSGCCSPAGSRPAKAVDIRTVRPSRSRGEELKSPASKNHSSAPGESLPEGAAPLRGTRS